MAGKKLTAEEEKILKNYCRALPVIMESSHEIHVMTGAEITELEEALGEIEKEGIVLDPEKKYPYSMPVQIAMNHYRRLKRAWLKDGQSGIQKYLNNVARVMQQNETTDA